LKFGIKVYGFLAGAGSGGGSPTLSPTFTFRCATVTVHPDRLPPEEKEEEEEEEEGFGEKVSPTVCSALRSVCIPPLARSHSLNLPRRKEPYAHFRRHAPFDKTKN